MACCFSISHSADNVSRPATVQSFFARGDSRNCFPAVWKLPALLERKTCVQEALSGPDESPLRIGSSLVGDVLRQTSPQAPIATSVDGSVPVGSNTNSEQNFEDTLRCFCKVCLVGSCEAIPLTQLTECIDSRTVLRYLDSLFAYHDSDSGCDTFA